VIVDDLKRRVEGLGYAENPFFYRRVCKTLVDGSTFIITDEPDCDDSIPFETPHGSSWEIKFRAMVMNLLPWVRAGVDAKFNFTGVSDVVDVTLFVGMVNKLLNSVTPMVGVHNPAFGYQTESMITSYWFMSVCDCPFMNWAIANALRIAGKTTAIAPNWLELCEKFKNILARKGSPCFEPQGNIFSNLWNIFDSIAGFVGDAAVRFLF